MHSNLPLDKYSDLDEEDKRDNDSPIKGECKYCGKSGMHWEQEGAKWTLVEKTGRIHNCPKKKQINLSLNTKI
jgi:hypothetical protein